jgi:hypothetical protein
MSPYELAAGDQLRRRLERGVATQTIRQAAVGRPARCAHLNGRPPTLSKGVHSPRTRVCDKELHSTPTGRSRPGPLRHLVSVGSGRKPSVFRCQHHPVAAHHFEEVPESPPHLHRDTRRWRPIRPRREDGKHAGQVFAQTLLITHRRDTCPQHHAAPITTRVPSGGPSPREGTPALALHPCPRTLQPTTAQSSTPAVQPDVKPEPAQSRKTHATRAAVALAWPNGRPMQRVLVRHPLPTPRRAPLRPCRPPRRRPVHLRPPLLGEPPRTRLGRRRTTRGLTSALSAPAHAFSRQHGPVPSRRNRPSRSSRLREAALCHSRVHNQARSVSPATVIDSASRARHEPRGPRQLAQSRRPITRTARTALSPTGGTGTGPLARQCSP